MSAHKNPQNWRNFRVDNLLAIQDQVKFIINCINNEDIDENTISKYVDELIEMSQNLKKFGE